MAHEQISPAVGAPGDRGTRRAVAARTAALTLVAAAALAGCQGTNAPAARISPSAAPSIDDSSVNVVPPDGAPTVDPSSVVRTGPAASPGADAAGPVAARADASSAGAGVTAGVEARSDSTTASTSGGTAGTARTVPGLSDGAVALPPTTQVANDGRCRVAALKLEPIDLQGSPGGTYANFRLVNVSKSACAVRGYVGATLLGDSGPMATSVRHEDGPDVWVKVVPGGAAQFHLRFPNPMSGPTPCNPPNAPRLRVTLPSTSGTLTGATPEGGIQACNGQLSSAPLGST